MRAGRTSSAIAPWVSACGLLALLWAIPAQAAPAFHFESICRSDPATNKDIVTVVLHDGAADTGTVHAPLVGATVNVLWSYVDYRHNHAVFRYKQATCVTARDGSCTFNGGSGRARWQLAEVVGYDLGVPAFDTEPTALCPNSFMIDFW
jgi:hypothetical protein